MINKIGVIGAGTMGNGIAQVFAQAGFEVRLVDASAPALERARATIGRASASSSRRASSPRPTATRRWHGSRPATNVDALADSRLHGRSDLRGPRAKCELFARLDAITRPDVILASNTSSISITTLGAATDASGSGARHALHEPGAADDAGRVDPRTGDVGRNDGTQRRLCAAGSERPESKRPTTRGSSPTAS